MYSAGSPRLRPGHFLKEEGGPPRALGKGRLMATRGGLKNGGHRGSMTPLFPAGRSEVRLTLARWAGYGWTFSHSLQSSGLPLGFARA